MFLISSRRPHESGALVTGIQTCAATIYVLRPRRLSMKRSCRRNRHAACDCRARADGIEPSLDVGNGRPFQPMQREACDPWIGRDIGDRIVVRRQIRTLAEFLVENRVEPVDLLLVAPERVASMGGI